MYNILLILHSWNRWVVLILSLIVIYRAFQGWRNQKEFLKKDQSLGGFFIGSLHLQLLVGLILYFALSPVVETAFTDFGAAMGNPDLRFWAVEHTLGMFLAVVVAQVGRIVSKKAPNDTLKHKRAFIYYSIALMLMLVSIPYTDRPWFRF